MERRDKKIIGYTKTNNQLLGISFPRKGEKMAGEMIKSTGRDRRGDARSESKLRWQKMWKSEELRKRGTCSWSAC